ncbi:unnamed protein product, partial [Rangifer tarandus platyrhynchus]
MLPPPACGSGHCACAEPPGGGALVHPLFSPCPPSPSTHPARHPSSLPQPPRTDRQVSRCMGTAARHWGELAEAGRV